jgi:hypothetical protein
MGKYTKHTLKKIEELFKEMEYTIRYEKGNFQSGYCVVKDQRVAVINKFFDTDARVNTLAEILRTLEVDESSLSENGAKIFRKWSKTEPEQAQEESPSK